MEATIYNIAGKEAGKVTLPENIFGLTWNADLVHQVVVSMQSGARGPIAHTKDRGEVRGGGKKPWQQKGTGRARHGSSRSPIWKGGGVTHGPRNEKIYARKVNQKMRQKALLVALSRKVKDGEVIFIDRLEMTQPKTRDAQGFLTALTKAGFTMKKKNAALIALPVAHAATMKSFRNLSNINLTEVRNLNPVSVLGSKYVVLAEPQLVIDTLAKKKIAQTK